MANDVDRLFRSVFESSHEGMLISGPDNRIIQANKAAATLLGYSLPEAMIGVPLIDLFLDASTFEPVRNELLTKGFCEDVELSFKCKDGKTIDVLGGATIQRDQNGEVQWTYAHFINITLLKKKEYEQKAYKSDLEAIVSTRTAALQSTVARLTKESGKKNKAERELIQSQERYALAQRAAKIANWEWDIVNDKITWSETIEPMFGFKPGEFKRTYEAFVECVHPEDRELVTAAVNECLKTGEDYAIDHRIARPDGSIGWVAEMGEVIQNSKGEAIRMIGLVQDISNRKVEERAVQLAKFSIDRTGDAVYWISSDSSIVYANDAACNALGYSKEEIFNVKVLDIDPHMTKEGWAEHFKQVRERKSFSLETEHRAKNGRIFPVEVTTNYFKYDKKEYIFAFVRDITDRKEAEKALRESEERYRFIADNVKDAIWVRDLATQKFLYISPAIESITGYTQAEMMEIPKEEMLTPESNKRAQKMLAELLSDFKNGKELNRQFTITLEGHRKDGKPFVQEINASVTRDQDGNPNSILGVTRDVTDRMRAEEELKQREQRFRSIIENTKAGYFFIDIEGRYQDVNDAWLRMHGFASADDVIGKHFSLSQKIEDIEDANDFFKGILSDDPAYTSGEFSRQLKDGSTGYHSFSARPVFRFGELAGVEGFLIDITGRMLAEAALEESEKKFRNIVESSPMGMHMYQLESDGRLVFTGANPAADRLLGVNNDQFIGKTLEEAFPALVETEAPARYREAADLGESWSTEQIVYEEDQIQGAFEVHAFQTSPGEMAAMFWDITDRKRAAEALKEQKEFTDSAIDAQHDTFFVFDPKDGKPILWNRAFRQTSGFSDDEIAQKKAPDEWYDQEDLKLAAVEMRRILEKGTGKVELSLITKTGKRIPTEYSSSVIRDSHGDPKYIISIGRDISERKQAEEEKTKLEERLRQAQKMEAIGTLAGGIAHDFNNILTGVQGYSEMILMELQPADPLRDQVQDILKAVEHASSLTRQLLAFSRKQIIQPVSVNLNKVLANAKVMLSRIIQENIEIVYRPSRNSEYIHVDPNQINQVLVNLASNAKDAMPFGGKLIFTTSRELIDEKNDPGDLDLSPGEYVKLTIEDTGRGMTEETQGRAFEPFFTTKGRAEHSGMGLATVFGIIKQNSGNVYLESREFEGTTVTIYFPYVPGKAIEAEHAGKQAELAGDETILLVEDEEMVRNMARRLLERKGYKVLDASSGKAALSISRDHIGKIHLLLSDVIMPTMNGRELYNRLHSTQPKMKVLFMSGYSEEFIAEFGMLEDGTHFISKPFKMDELARKVRMVLDE